jgi:hypothetical protein
MFMQRLTLAILRMCGLLMAQDQAGPAAAKAQRIPFPQGSVLRLIHSDGELTITGWDQAQMEMTASQTSRVSMDPLWREKAAGGPAPASSHIAVERHGDEVIVRTAPHRGVDLDYQISVPRDAKIIIEHRSGEVYLNDLAGDIRAAVRNGSITLRLAPDGRYDINAKTGIGDIVSEFPGRAHRRPWIFAHEFAGEAAPAAAHKLDIRACYGDIILMKIRKP